MQMDSLMIMENPRRFVKEKAKIENENKAGFPVSDACFVVFSVVQTT